MPNDFTASQLPLLLRRFDDVFTDGRTKLEEKTPPVTAQAIAERQTAQVDQITNSAGKCVAHRVAFLKKDSVTLPTVSTTPQSNPCIIPAGNTLSSDSKDYSPNIYIDYVATVDDDQCKDAFTFLDKSARSLSGAMALIADSLNRYIINRLVANAMTNVYAGTGTIAGTTTEYLAGAQTPELLAEWALQVIKNKMASNSFLVNGTNFWASRFNADFFALDVDKRSYQAMLSSMQTYWDVMALEDEVGSRSSFLIDPNMNFIFGESHYSDQAVTIAANSSNTTSFRLPLAYMDANGERRNFTYNNGTMVETMYVDVDYQKECLGSNGSTGRKTFRHNWKLMLNAGFAQAPASDGKSGILQNLFV